MNILLVFCSFSISLVYSSNANGSDVIEVMSKQEVLDLMNNSTISPEMKAEIVFWEIQSIKSERDFLQHRLSRLEELDAALIVRGKLEFVTRASYSEFIPREMRIDDWVANFKTDEERWFCVLDYAENAKDGELPKNFLLIKKFIDFLKNELQIHDTHVMARTVVEFLNDLSDIIREYEQTWRFLIWKLTENETKNKIYDYVRYKWRAVEIIPE